MGKLTVIFGKAVAKQSHQVKDFANAFGKETGPMAKQAINYANQTFYDNILPGISGAAQQVGTSVRNLLNSSQLGRDLMEVGKNMGELTKASVELTKSTVKASTKFAKMGSAVLGGITLVGNYLVDAVGRIYSYAEDFSRKYFIGNVDPLKDNLNYYG